MKKQQCEKCGEIGFCVKVELEPLPQKRAICLKCFGHMTDDDVIDFVLRKEGADHSCG